MEYVGYILILLAGSGLGLYASHRLRRQVTMLERIERLLQRWIQELAYTARPMKELWLSLAASGLFDDLPLLTDTAAGLERADFLTAFTTAVESSAARGLLTDEGRRLLLEMGQGCGRYDLAGQGEHLRRYGERLSALREELSRQAATKGHVYRVMGPAAGAALVLLLM